MKLAVISKADSSGGGASRVATELVDHLLDAGADVCHWAARRYGEASHPIRRVYGDRPVVDYAVRLGHTLLRKIGAPELLPWERLNPGLRALLGADLIHVHDITNALAVDTLGWLARQRPLVWTLHDCSPFTGGCLFPRGCTAFQRRCGQCPEHGVWPLEGWFDLTGLLLAQRRRVLRQTRLWPVAPSRWMADMAARSGLLPPVTVIGNGIDLDSFRPSGKAAARRALGIDPQRTVLAICAGALADTRKGVPEALTVARAAAAYRPLVLAIGRPAPALAKAFPDLDLHFSGFVTDRRTLATNYAAADALLYPSSADNQPLTVMEAMACGTPVLGFDYGGIPELVRQDEHGWLVPTGAVDALVQATMGALADPNRLRRWGAAAAQRARQEFGWDRCLAAHLALYRSLPGVARGSGGTGD